MASDLLRETWSGSIALRKPSRTSAPLTSQRTSKGISWKLSRRPAFPLPFLLLLPTVAVVDERRAFLDWAGASESASIGPLNQSVEQLRSPEYSQKSDSLSCTFLAPGF